MISRSPRKKKIILTNLQVIKKALKFSFKKSSIEVVFELLVPKRSDEHLGAFRHGDHLGDGPHQGAVHSH